MKVAYYYNGTPNKFATDFCNYVEDVEFLHNKCDKDVDFIYCGSPDTNGCLRKALDAKTRYNKKLICYVWDIPKELKDLEHVANNNANMLRVCDGVISACEYTQKVLKDNYRIKSSVLYFYAPDYDALITAPSEDKVRQVIHVSRFVPHKQHEIVIDALWNMKDIELVCMGAGDRDNDYFKSLIDRSGGNVRFLNNVRRTEVLREIGRSQLLISASRYEGFGLTPIEALLLGTPIILYDMPVFREIYENDVPYFTCAAELTDHIENFFDSKYQDMYRTEMLRIAKPHIDSFTPKIFAKRWFDECTRLLQASK